MARVRRMRTQEPTYWKSDFRVTEQELDFLTGVILERGQPASLDTLVTALMFQLIQTEKERAARQVSDGEVYRPADTYETGQTLYFTDRDMATATVVSTRPGVNPRYDAFTVVRVAFQDGTEAEFASGLDIEHPLNRPLDELVGASEEDLADEEILATYAPYVAPVVEQALHQDHGWIHFDGVWFLNELLPEFHVGHLNLAEAAIYEAGVPLPVSEMLARLDLGLAGSQQAQLFSLNHALANDERFINVGTRTAQNWFLRALMPAAAVARPAVHAEPFRPEGHEYVGLTMLDVIEALGDELDSLPGASINEGRDIAFQVSFPHLYAGTMPAGRRLLALFTYEQGQRLPITLVDGRNGKSFSAWLVPDEGYVAGLGDWYKQVGMVVGGLVTVTNSDQPNTLKLSVTVPRSSSSGWVRQASVDDNALVLQMQLGRIGVRHDAATLIDVADPAAIAGLMARTLESDRSLYALVKAVFAELAKLSPQGVASCQALYSAVNMYHRSGAVPVFAILTRSACFDPVGSGDWAYDGSLEGTEYETPDDMRERPLSRRNDLARDQVVHYAATGEASDGA
ncbi:MAG: hypothetical protein ACOX2L_04845 [Anaerolineae bacterium]|jgi:hypothetical protein|nr:hypothetical protein [Chloroflexota bacterium]